MNKALTTIAIALISALSLVPSVAGSSSFTASVVCTGPRFGVIGQSFGYWNWTLNGVPIGPFVHSGIIAASGVVGCNSTGGGPNTTTASGRQPANADGINVRVTSQIKGCYHLTDGSQSFSPGGSVSISVKATCTRVSYGVVVTESGTFTVTS